ncbi:hypothetical protein TREMEDRAFT_58364 [Tremella mesenterica DSM 1558]|uniref:uncharacterized protein n=1 Tax=Tremella mesenterica (strain ATCC 24925 / CBS 8224 / DSM 1558 / NBRC 9311 / NRRL Y-6157 / RJB 2259-6 / UBC 559-6) TaxID=578456 RepID=UPI0003F49C61|nr:uncharacterized protein TREMEDRAFT_58364 [Tremella mesenterica DSM 1558]EIW72209.1 hypothetical protein TREMEDRAFT_58364 [Tremella mesenterica DSM 1558]
MTNFALDEVSLLIPSNLVDGKRSCHAVPRDKNLGIISHNNPAWRRTTAKSGEGNQGRQSRVEEVRQTVQRTTAKLAAVHQQSPYCLPLDISLWRNDIVSQGLLTVGQERRRNDVCDTPPEWHGLKAPHWTQLENRAAREVSVSGWVPNNATGRKAVTVTMTVSQIGRQGEDMQGVAD